MPHILIPRQLPAEAENVKNTFSSWDACMTEDYCKYPAIIGIIIGSLILISVIWCCARCLCCGAECCCGCLSCFNRCCPSPRRKTEGYQKPQMYPPYNQYQSPQPPMYGGGGYGGPQTATFDAPSRGKYNEDSLPAMPSWGNATSRRVEEEPSDVDIEMEKMDHPQQQHSPPDESLLQHHRQESAEYEDQHHSGDIGAMPAGGPYGEHDPYQQHEDDYASQQHNIGYAVPHPNNNYPSHPGGGYNAQQNNGNVSPYSPQQHNGNVSPYSPQPHNPQQAANRYYDFSQQGQQQRQQQYFGASPISPMSAAPSVYPPTYHTRPPSTQYSTDSYGAPPPTYRTAPPTVTNSPPQQHVRMPSSGSYAVGRKPVSGSWRDV